MKLQATLPIPYLLFQLQTHFEKNPLGAIFLLSYPLPYFSLSYEEISQAPQGTNFSYDNFETRRFL